MSPSGSVEVGPEAVKGEGRARRYNKTADSLVTSPSPNVRVIADLLASSAAKWPQGQAVCWRDQVRIIEEEKEVTKKVDGEEVKEMKKWTYFQLSDYKSMTYGELAELVKDAASALVETGHSKDTIFNVYASTSVHWQVMANACASQSITFATAYDSLGSEGLQHSLAEPDVYGVFTNANLVGTIASVIDKTPTVKVLVYDGKDSDVKAGSIEKIRAAGVKVLSFVDFIKLGKEKPHAPHHPEPEDIACIMYTSGSTGAPKGVLLSNANIVASVSGALVLLGDLLTPEARFIAFLPLAHIFEFAVEMTMLYAGVVMGYGTVKTLTDASVRNCVGDMRAFKPTIMCGVPAVWELIRKGIMGKVRAGGAVKQNLFNFAFAAKRALGPHSFISKILDAVVFKAVKEATGGHLMYAVNGGAAIAKETQEFLQTCLVPTLIQGYGMTESSALSFILPPSLLQSGVVGVPVPSVEAKLVDFPDANYFSTNDPPQGEVWIRGATISRGYYKRDDVTAEAFTDDGWLKTGDIGQWNKDGTLSVIDRKKNLVKLAGGEYIALERLEAIYKSCGLVANICLYADPNANKAMAIVFPHEANLKHFLGEKSISGGDDLEEMCKSDQVRKTVLAELNATGKKAGLKPLEQLQTLLLDPVEWTPQSGMLTAASKLQRKVIHDKHKERIKAIYP